MINLDEIKTEAKSQRAKDVGYKSWSDLCFRNENEPDEETFDEVILIAMREAIRQALELAANEARILHHDGFNKINTSISYFQNGADNLQIDKQSITALINKVV